MKQASPEFAARLLERYNGIYLREFQKGDFMFNLVHDDLLHEAPSYPQLNVLVFRDGPTLEYRMPPENRLSKFRRASVTLANYRKDMIANGEQVAKKKSLKLVVEKSTDTHLRFRFVEK